MRAPVFLVSLVTACAVPILVSSPRPGTPATSPLPASSVSASAEVIRLTNVYRSGKGLGELGTSPGLTEAARLHAEQMARFQQLAHTISDARYPTLHDRLAAAGYAYAAAGENIAWNRPDADDVMNTWLNSTGHRANILDSAVTEIGVAVARSARGDPYWVQVFGRPR